MYILCTFEPAFWEISIYCIPLIMTMTHGRIQRGVGDRGSRPSLKNHKNIGCLSNTEKSQSYHLNGVSLAGR